MGKIAGWFAGIVMAIATTIAAVGYIVIGLGATVIHVWTIIIAYEIKGFFAAFISFLLPIISAIYWAIHLWLEMDTFFNTYTIAVAGYGCLFILCAVIMGLIDN